jgi:hypothetical protein
MNKKIEYISRLLKKMSSKGLEIYVISRIWHLLDNDEVKIVPQQYVRHSDGTYSLTDLYFPQFDFHVEVNEPGHYITQEKISSDALREKNIVESSGHHVKVINCTESIENIHLQIDAVIRDITAAIDLQKREKTFKPWNPEFEYKAEFYKNLTELKVAENIALETIEQICELFNVKVPKMGYLRKGAAPFPPMENTILWWPSDYNRNWENKISPDSLTITERAVNEKNPGDHAFGVLNNPHNRVTFFKDRDILGYTYYRFKGVFQLDMSRSNKVDGLFWVRVSDFVRIKF